MQLRRRDLLLRALAGGAALSTLSACGGNGSDNRDHAIVEAARALDGVVPQWLQRTGVPGAAVSVAYRGQIVYARGFGVRRVDQPALVDADTVFPLASYSKAIGATVMMTQMPGGANGVASPAVTWDTPIEQLMPDFKLAYSDPTMNSRLTLGNLYSHRSGLPDHAGDRLESIGYSRTEILQRLSDVTLGPFGGYEYTNFGVTAAAQAMANARGVDWETLSQKTIYQPLGMASTSSRFADLEGRGNRAWGHVQVGLSYATYGQEPAQYQVQIPQRDPDPQAPAGGVSSSVNDLAHWMMLVLGSGQWQGQQLLGPGALRAALTPYGSDSHKYGYGFIIGSDPTGHADISHSGAFTLGAATAFFMWPGEQLGITVLTNAQPRGLAEAIATVFAGNALGYAPGAPSPDTDWLAAWQGLPQMHDLYQPFGDLAGKTPPENPAPPSQPLASYAGSYGNAYYGAAQIALGADGQTLELVMGPAAVHYALRHWDGDEFAFDINSEDASPGSVSALAFTPQGMQIEYFSKDLTHGQFVRA